MKKSIKYFVICTVAVHLIIRSTSGNRDSLGVLGDVRDARAAPLPVLPQPVHARAPSAFRQHPSSPVITR